MWNEHSQGWGGQVHLVLPGDVLIEVPLPRWGLEHPLLPPQSLSLRASVLDRRSMCGILVRPCASHDVPCLALYAPPRLAELAVSPNT